MSKKETYIAQLSTLDEVVLERLASLVPNQKAIDWFKITYKWMQVKAFLNLAK